MMATVHTHRGPIVNMDVETLDDARKWVTENFVPRRGHCREWVDPAHSVYGQWVYITRNALTGKVVRGLDLFLTAEA